MQAQTDMKSIIEIAETFLEREYIYQPSVVPDVDHPFLNSSVTGISNPDVIQELNSRNIQLLDIGGQHILSILDSPEVWELYKKDRRLILRESKSFQYLSQNGSSNSCLYLKERVFKHKPSFGLQ